MKRTAFVLGLALASAAFGASVAGVDLADSTRLGDAELVLQGGALRSKMMFKVYVAALYLPAKSSDAAAILAADQPRRMAMHFLRAVGSDKVCEGWIEGLAANTPEAPPELKRQFDQLCALVPDTEAGTLVALDYLPGKGTSISVAGKAVGTIAGKPFADAVLGCWIGPRPGPGPEFKQALLGG